MGIFVFEDEKYLYGVKLMGIEANRNKEKSAQDGEKAIEYMTYGKPLNGLILVKRTGEVRAKIGGIHVPENAREKPCEAIVIAVGDERISEFGAKIPHIVEIGDRIMYNKFGGIEVSVDGNEFMIMKENEIFMILPPKSEEQIAEDRMNSSSLILH